jgi:hypothetical protein
MSIINSSFYIIYKSLNRFRWVHFHIRQTLHTQNEQNKSPDSCERVVLVRKKNRVYAQKNPLIQSRVSLKSIYWKTPAHMTQKKIDIKCDLVLRLACKFVIHPKQVLFSKEEKIHKEIKMHASLLLILHASLDHHQKDLI